VDLFRYVVTRCICDRDCGLQLEFAWGRLTSVGDDETMHEKDIGADSTREKTAVRGLGIYHKMLGVDATRHDMIRDTIDRQIELAE
jgi:hypothetical protein